MLDQIIMITMITKLKVIIKKNVIKSVQQFNHNKNDIGRAFWILLY